MSLGILTRPGAGLSLGFRWIQRLDGLVRLAVPDPGNPKRAVVVLYAEKRRVYEALLIDVSSGRIIWRREVANGGYGSPTFFKDLVVVHSRFTGITALGKEDGTVAWQYMSKSRVRSTLVAYGSLLVFSAGNELLGLDPEGRVAMCVPVPRVFMFGAPVQYGEHWLTLATSPHAHGESRICLLCLSPAHGEVWSVDLGPGGIASSDTSGILVIGDVATIAGDHVICAVDISKGEVVWRRPVSGLGQRHICTSHCDMIFSTTVDGHVRALSTAGTVKWERILSEHGIWSPASIMGDRVLVPSEGVLYVLDGETGRTLQQIPVGQCPYSAVTFSGDIALLGGGDPPYWGLLFGFDVLTKPKHDVICSLAQQRRYSDVERSIDLVLQVSGHMEEISDVFIDFSTIGGNARQGPAQRDGDRFTFVVAPGSGYRWGTYALPIVLTVGSKELQQTVLLVLDEIRTVPARVLLSGFEGIRQKQADWSGAALMAAVRNHHGDPVEQGKMREMVDAIRERAGYLPFDTWRIITRRALSTRAKCVEELPEFDYLSEE
jgi:outer membrane protein assembly factor BamB